MTEIRRFPDAQALAQGAAAFFAQLGGESIKANGRFVVALSGGSTPRQMYQQLVSEFADSVDWHNIHVFWGDERTVHPDRADSNYRMAYEMLLSKVKIPASNIHRMTGELDPQDAARRYEDELQQFFGNTTPRFDLILLGMGDDGHTASLFPETEALEVTDRWVVANYVSKLETWRLTLTYPVLNAAAHVLFLVSGAAKSEILYEVLHGQYQPTVLPAQRVQPVEGQLYWFADNDAAALI